MKSEPNEDVLEWLDQQPPSSVWITAITVFEIEYGIRKLPRGKRRDNLKSSFKSLLSEDLEERILSFDEPSAFIAGELAAKLESKGRRADIRDLQIASIAKFRNATVATRNVKDFELVCGAVNPWEAGN